MAQRRMFSKKITETDLFLDMPMSAQCLYFHLNMSADDDGFIGNAKTIRRMIGASEDDLKLLLSKEFLIPFKSGVVVIKDWKIHNYIRSDRYSETVYQEEKKGLKVLDNGRYEAGLQNVIPNDIPTDNQNGYQRDTQVRLGKDRLGKGREEITITGEEQSSGSSGCDVHQFYQQNFGVEPPTIQQDIDYWIEDLSAPVVIEALKRTVEAEKPYSYAKGIMRKWAGKGIRTMEQVEQDATAWDRKNNGNQEKEGVNEYESLGF
jgi:DnaD/phage-associated family protein